MGLRSGWVENDQNHHTQTVRNLKVTSGGLILSKEEAYGSSEND